MNKTFNIGDVVMWDPTTFNLDYWNKESEENRLKYYGKLGYGAKERKLFVFLTEINQAPGHCVLVDMDDGHVEWMRHTDNFRLVTEDEF